MGEKGEIQKKIFLPYFPQKVFLWPMGLFFIIWKYLLAPGIGGRRDRGSNPWNLKALFQNVYDFCPFLPWSWQKTEKQKGIHSLTKTKTGDLAPSTYKNIPFSFSLFELIQKLESDKNEWKFPLIILHKKRCFYI